MSTATAESNRAQLENLKVQLGFCSVRAPISGRISMANVKVGNFVRQADSTPMATINQMAPVYVSFTVPQKELPEIRQALAAKTAHHPGAHSGREASRRRPGLHDREHGRPATGMATIRATMPNTDEGLWPGTLVSVDLTLRTEEAVVVPTNAVQVSQTGSFVFVVDNDVAKVRHVKVERQVGDDVGDQRRPQAGETVVTDGPVAAAQRGRGRHRAGATAAARASHAPRVA